MYINLQINNLYEKTKVTNTQNHHFVIIFYTLRLIFFLGYLKHLLYLQGFHTT